jgi:hypothetical protein
MRSFSDVYTTTIESPVTSKEYEVDVHYHYSPGCKGARDGLYAQLEPDEDVELIIERVVLAGQPENAIDLSPLIKDATEDMENKILEHLNDLNEAAREDAYESRRDR